MRSSIGVTLAAAALLLTTVSMAPPAHAQWFGNRANSRANNQEASITASNFATTQANLRSQISAAVSSGRISSATAANLMAQLDQANAISQNGLASGNLTNNDVNAAMSIFTSVGNAINSGVNTNMYATPFYNNNPYLYGNNWNPWF